MLAVNIRVRKTWGPLVQPCVQNGGLSLLTGCITPTFTQ